jgi:glucose/mannose-6-phosphate isomerase
MGGSASAGDVVAPLYAALGIQFDVWRDYGLPHWVDREVLVVAASYSGDTEETVSAAQTAQQRGCPLVVVTAGGRLLQLSSSAPDASFPAIRLPAGLPPRAALGYNLGALLHGVAVLGAGAALVTQIDAAVATLTAGNARYLGGVEATTAPLGVSVPAASVDTTATAATMSDLASAVAGRFVVIYSSGGEAHGAAARLKAQINENAKCPAYHVRFPELDHNDIVGWELASADRSRFALLVLRGGDESGADRRRLEATLSELAADLPLMEIVRSRGEQPLARALSLVQWGDYFSCFLALARKVDPLPVARIERLKRSLEKGD